jgi:alpha-tubulin suppressor-like RCC1 family protein
MKIQNRGLNRGILVALIVGKIASSYAASDPLSSWSFTDDGFISGGQNGAHREYMDPSSVPASPWSYRSTDHHSLRLSYENDNNCANYNPYTQSGTAVATVTAQCPIRMYVSWSGQGETQDSNYELMNCYIDGNFVGQAHAPGGGLHCEGGMGPVVSFPPPPQYVDMSPHWEGTPPDEILTVTLHTLSIDSTTNDPLYHTNAYYQFDLTFVPIGSCPSDGPPPILPILSQVSAGGSHTLARALDGTVWAWGWNQYGQLGDGTTTTRTTPVQVPGLTGVIAVSAGGTHSLALKSDGTVWAWGLNNWGQIGDGTTTDRHSPVQITALSGVTSISAGFYHNLALTPSDLYAWGYNAMGQCGDDSTINRTSPVEVAHGDGLYAIDVAQISGGFYHSLALRYDGRVWAWGYNAQGALGDGTWTDRHTPVQITLGSTDIRMISAGCGFHSLALDGNGYVYSWGYNAYGQLGLNNTANQNYATPVGGIPAMSAVSAGVYHSHALRKGHIWSWGNNQYGQLGDGTTTQRITPVLLSTISDVNTIEAGGYFSLAVKFAPTSLQSWGGNWLGQLGNGTTANSSTPVTISGFAF